MTGLPPTPEEIDEYVAIRHRTPTRRVVDRLLASPQLRRALGAALAGSSCDSPRPRGFEYDRHIPDAWRFRDYVIGSLNRDKPFDRFLIEQIAGDEFGPDDRECPDRIDLPPTRTGPSQRGQSRHRPQPQRGPDRAYRHHRHRVPWADHRLCPLPQPQARTDLAEGLLPSPGVLRGHRGARHQSRHPGPAEAWKEERKRFTARSRSSRRRHGWRPGARSSD